MLWCFKEIHSLPTYEMIVLNLVQLDVCARMPPLLQRLQHCAWSQQAIVLGL